MDWALCLVNIMLTVQQHVPTKSSHTGRCPETNNVIDVMGPHLRIVMPCTIIDGGGTLFMSIQKRDTLATFNTV